MIALMPSAHRAVHNQQLFGLCATLYRFSINNVFYGAVMQKPPLDPDVADLAPTSSALTGYYEQHLVTYLRLLDAAKDGTDWAKVAALVLHIDPAREPDRARRAWESHLARARWVTEHGYRHLLRGGAFVQTVPTFGG